MFENDAPLQEQEFAFQREQMVERQIVSRGVIDALVLEAMRRVPRHRFVPDKFLASAYSDGPLSIGFGQTISQPYVVASMTEELRLSPESKVLEIGTGSGYQTAILAEIAAAVYTIELIPELATCASAKLKDLGYRHVNARIGDGHEGWPEAAPFDAIVVTAAADELPEELTAQLSLNGIMVVPISERHSSRQVLVRVQKTPSGLIKQELYDVRFVPFVKRRE